MESVTIDQLPNRIHERYAQDQKYVDPLYRNECAQVAPHAESMVGILPIYPSQLDALFHKEPTYACWAYFCPPPFFRMRRKNCFASTLISGMKMDLEMLDIEGPSSTIHVEKQRLALFSLFEEVACINGMLQQVESEKMRYQKG